MDKNTLAQRIEAYIKNQLQEDITADQLTQKNI